MPSVRGTLALKSPSQQIAIGFCSCNNGSRKHVFDILGQRFVQLEMNNIEQDEMGVPVGGIVPALVTPLLTNRELDRVSYNRLLDRVITAGVHGIFVLGS